MEGIFDLSLLRDLLSQFLSVIPNLIGAIFILLIGWIISKLVARVVKRALVAIKIDSLGEKLNEIDIVSKANVKIQLSSVIAKMIYYILMLIFIIAATSTLGMPVLSDLVSDIVAYIPLLISAFAVLLIGLLVCEFLKNIALTAMQSLGIPSAKLIANIIFYFLFLTVVVSALSQAQINTDFITSNLTVIIGAVAAAFAFGYGFASRDLMANFLASFYSKDKVKLGDVITIDGMKGEIIAVDNTSITLQTDQSQVIVPLSKLTANAIEIHNS
ncbi:MAG: mechanosensitive ion channel domain-containing protein [Bacteroidota bacterium]